MNPVSHKRALWFGVGLWVFAWAVFGIRQAHAQSNDLTFDVDVSDQGAPVITWSTTPTATSCQASGLWSGSKAPSGSETLPPITASGGYGLLCDFAGESIASLSWTIPLENTDGEPYDNPQDTILVWSQDAAAIEGLQCWGVTEAEPPAGVEFSIRPHPQTMHAVTGLTPGTWTFGAFARNADGLCSTLSNTASKEATAGDTVSSTISFGVPNPPGGLGAE